MLSGLERKHRLDLNIASLTAARGWAGLFASLGSAQVTPAQFLPYPEVTTPDGAEEFSPPTKATIIRLIEQERLPPWAIAEILRMIN